MFEFACFCRFVSGMFSVLYLFCFACFCGFVVVLLFCNKNKMEIKINNNKRKKEERKKKERKEGLEGN